MYIQNHKITKTAFFSLLTAALAVTGCRSYQEENTRHASAWPAASTGSYNSEMAARDHDANFAQGGTADADSAAGGHSFSGDASNNRIEISAQGGTNMVIPLFRESVQVAKRLVDAGSIRIQKRVTTETVNQPVELRRETVTVDRLPASNDTAQGGSAQSFADTSNSAQGGALNQFEEGEIVIRLQREEPVVEKQVVPAGRIVAEVRPQTEQTTIESQVRREEIAVNTVGNPQNVTISENLRADAAQSDDTAVGGGTDPGGTTQGAAAAGGTTSSSGANAITDISMLTEDQAATSLNGRRVQLRGVQVQEVLGDRFVAIGADENNPVYVRLSQPAQNLSEGQRVNVTGTIAQVPSSLESLGLGEQANQALQNEKIYVNAQRLEVSQE